MDRAAPYIDETFPFMGDVCRVVGALAVEAGNDEVAAKFLHLALEIDPDIYGNAHRYARFLVERGDRSEALDAIAQGLEHGAPDREELLGLQDWILESE